MVLGTALFALKAERRWLWVGVVAAIFNPVLNLLAIPGSDHWLHNGAIGAALVEVATELLMLSGALLLLPRGLIDRHTAGMSGRVVVAGIGLVGVTMVLRPVSLPLAVATGGLTYIALAAAFRVVQPADYRAVYRVTRESLVSRLGG